MEFKDEIRSIGIWNLPDKYRNEIVDLAYYMFLEEVKEQKDSGEWIKRESTFVADQMMFTKKLKSGRIYYNLAKDKLRGLKVNKLCKLSQEGI